MKTLKFFVFGTVFVLLIHQKYLDALPQLSHLQRSAPAFNLTTQHHEDEIKLMIAPLQQFIIQNFDAYVIAHPDSVFAREIDQKRDLNLLFQSTYELKNTICNVNLEKILDLNENEVEFNTIFEAISRTCLSYEKRIYETYAKMLKIIYRLRPIKFFIYLAELLQNPNPNNISFKPWLEDAIKRFFFTKLIGNNKYLKKQPPGIKYPDTYAFGHEACDYDDYIFQRICGDLNYIANKIRQGLASRTSEICKQQFALFTRRYIDALHETSQLFKKMLCDEYVKLLFTNAMINPPPYAEKIRIATIKELEVQRRWEAFCALIRVCLAIFTEYNKKTAGNCKTKLIAIAKHNPLSLIIAIHRGTLNAIKQNKPKYDKFDVESCVWLSYHKLDLNKTSIEGPKPMLYEDIESEPGLGDENGKFDLKHFDDVCFLILHQFDLITKKLPKWQMMRNRLGDMRFKSPMRFRRILCELYEEGMDLYTQVEEKSKFAYGLIYEAISLMFTEIYSKRIIRNTDDPKAELTILGTWRYSDPFYFMYFLHNDVLENGEDDGDHVAQFMGSVLNSEVCLYKTAEPFHLPQSHEETSSWTLTY